MPRLDGKVALVTASTDGIGLAVAQRLRDEGATVVVSSRKQARVDAAVAALGGDTLGVVCHVGNAAAREALVDQVVERFGRIDIFVSNAAVSPGMGGMLELTDAQWEKLWAINVTAAWALCKLVVPHMPADGGSAIVFVSSIAAYNPRPPLGAYGVTKSALLGLTRGLAAELAPAGIRVNCLAPGTIKTRFSQPLWAGGDDSPVLGEILQGRFGEVDEMAGCVAFLCSGDASYVTGETLVASGGVQSRL